MTAICPLSPAEARRALLLRDLTDPCQGLHAIQLIVEAVETALADRWAIPVRRIRSNPVVLVDDNYNRLRYQPDAVTRDARYSRYLSDRLMLRSHTSAAIPAALEALADAADPDALLSVPGIVYRRDAIDRQHVGEPHQLDLWRVGRSGPPLGEADLDELIDAVVAAALPGRSWRAQPRAHPYTQRGRQIDVAADSGWIEVGECGLAHPEVLAAAGVRSGGGLASGWGLDRLLMIRKDIDDIRVLRSGDPRIAGQMQDLGRYRAVSTMPAARRDISVAVDAPLDAEGAGDRIRRQLGGDADVVESIQIVSTTPAGALPLPARERLAMRDGQWNVLLRVELRALDRTLTADEANQLRDRIYAALHEGGTLESSGERAGL